MQKRYPQSQLYDDSTRTQRGRCRIRWNNLSQIAATLLCLTLFALPSPTHADGVNPLEELYVKSRLEPVKLILKGFGFTAIQQENGPLDCGKAKTWTYDFEKGFTYAVIGFGDSNSSNLFFELRRGRKTLQRGATPSITIPKVGKVSPHVLLWYGERPGELDIRATLKKPCDPATCAYGFVVMRKALSEGKDLPAWLPSPMSDQSEPNTLVRLAVIASLLTLVLLGLGLLYYVIRRRRQREE